MKLAATVSMGDDPEAFTKHVRRLEDIGVSSFWSGEAYSADAVSTMGMLVRGVGFCLQEPDRNGG